MTQASQAAMTPAEALARLKEGNARFIESRMADRDLLQQVRATSDGQYPFAAVLGCIDSRVPPELVFDQGIGDLFSVRIAGNFASTDILGSLEFACRVAGARLIVVLGHTNCGAISAACDGVQLGHLTGMLSKLEPAVRAARAPVGERSSRNPAFVQQAARKNVELTMESIRQQSPLLEGMLETGEVEIAGAMYNVETGEVKFY